MANSKQVEKQQVVVLVDGVTCGKAENAVFSFTYRKKLVQSAILPLLQANQHYGYQHHIDAGTFGKWQAVLPELMSYKQTCEEAPGVMLESWADMTKYLLARAIADGKFNVGNDKVEVKVMWKGADLVAPEVKCREVKPKQEKSKVDEADLVGLALV